MARKGKRDDRLPQFVPMLHQTMDCPAWLALSPWAKALYPLLKRRAGYAGNSNGRVHLSVREAATYLNAHRNTAAKAFHDLQRKGFLVPRHIGTLGTAGAGVSTAWRLTELGTTDDPRPTKEFLRWQPGADFVVQKGKPPARKSETRPSERTGRHTRADVVELPCPSQRTGRHTRADVRP